jgi:hypothetical protein
MNRILRVVGVFLLSIAYARAQGNDVLALQLHAVHPTVVLGGGIELALEFVNVTQSPVYVWRTDDLGPQAIDVVARREACVYHVKPIHWASVASGGGNETYAFVPRKSPLAKTHP